VRRLGAERGVTVIQLAVVMPTVLFLLLTIVQFAFYEFSDQVAESAAQQGVTAATIQGGSDAAAVSAAQAVIDRQGNLLSQPGVTVTRSGQNVTVAVTGNSIEIVPGLTLPVAKTAAGPVEPAP
jgi:hypothetical protein